MYIAVTKRLHPKQNTCDVAALRMPVFQFVFLMYSVHSIQYTTTKVLTSSSDIYLTITLHQTTYVYYFLLGKTAAFELF